MGKDKFIRGALILTLAGLMVKVLGSFNRILLSRLLGGEGIGLYQTAYPIYLLLLSVSSAGVPVAVSIIVAEKVAQDDYAGARRIFKVTLVLMIGFGLLFALGLYWLTGVLITSGIIRDSRAYLALVVLTPAVFFSSILASFRGYFQGYQMMTPPAVSQILEQMVRVITMVVLAYYLLPWGLEYAAAGAAFGALPGSLTGLVVLGWFYRRANRQWGKKIAVQAARAGEGVLSIAKRLVLLALPVSCANIMIPVTSSIDMLLVPNCLGRAGFGVEAATTMFGYLAGMAQPLIMMATIPTMSLAASLVPAVSEAFTLQQQEVIAEKSALALKLCLLVTVPAAVGMGVLALPISKLLYGTMLAAPVIAQVAPSIVLLGVFQVTTGMLQGIGHTAQPMWNMVAGAVVKTVGLWFLASVPAWNILGAAWATNLNFAAVAGLNLYFLYRYRLSFPLGQAFKIVAVAAVMGIGAYFTYGAGSRSLPLVAALALSMGVAVVLYMVGIIGAGLLQRQELEKMPLVGKILRKLGR